MQKYTLKYDEFNKDAHSIDPYEAANAIVGFADFSKEAFGYIANDSRANLKINALKEGCVEIDFLIETVFAVAELGLTQTLTLNEFIKTLFSLYRHLQGNPIKKITQNGNGNVTVENNNGDIITINQLVVHAYLDPKVGSAVERYVEKPLSGQRTNVQILSEGKVVESVEKKEAKFFKKPNNQNALLENKSELYLRVIRPVFEGFTKWSFHDGSKKIEAEIEDQSFLEKVNSGSERFGSGDYLFVRLRSIQTIENRKLKAQYYIEEVLDHKHSENLEQHLLEL